MKKVYTKILQNWKVVWRKTEKRAKEKGIGSKERKRQGERLERQKEEQRKRELGVGRREKQGERLERQKGGGGKGSHELPYFVSLFLHADIHVNQLLPARRDGCVMTASMCACTRVCVWRYTLICLPIQSLCTFLTAVQFVRLIHSMDFLLIFQLSFFIVSVRKIPWLQFIYTLLAIWHQNVIN